VTDSRTHQHVNSGPRLLSARTRLTASPSLLVPRPRERLPCLCPSWPSCLLPLPTPCPSNQAQHVNARAWLCLLISSNLWGQWAYLTWVSMFADSERCNSEFFFVSVWACHTKKVCRLLHAVVSVRQWLIMPLISDNILGEYQGCKKPLLCNMIEFITCDFRMSRDHRSNVIGFENVFLQDLVTWKYFSIFVLFYPCVGDVLYE
jgi:hypothetical protein